MSDFILNPSKITTPNTDFDKLFGQFTKFTCEQLKQKYYNDTGFFCLAPDSLKTFYLVTLKSNLEWFRGNVPGIHPYGIFSCHQGGIACNTVADLITAGDFRIEATDPRYKNYIEDLINYKKVRKKLKHALPMLMACGFMLASIDVLAKNQWTINFTAGNRYFVETDGEGNLSAFRRLILFHSASLSDNDNGYYLVEDRWLKNIEGRNRCFHSYRIYSGPSSCDSLYTSLGRTTSIPDEIMREFQTKMGVCELDTIYELPFDDHLGAVVILCSKTCTGIEDHPEFSDSLIEHSKTFLLEYDETYTSKQKDRVMADKGVILPEQMLPTDFGVSTEKEYNVYLDLLHDKKTNLSNVFKRVRSMSLDEQKPFFFQSEYRQSDYNADLDQIKARIADSIKISASDFGSHTQLGDGNSEKTAKEVTVLTGISKTTIEEKRAMIADGMEELFRVILKYVFRDANAKCSMVFNTSQSADPISETQDIMEQVNGKILSRRTAMKRKNPNMSEEEINEMIREIEEETKAEQKLQVSMMGGMNDDYSGDGNIIPGDEDPSGNREDGDLFEENNHPERQQGDNEE